MRIHRKTLAAVYVLVGLVALVLTWLHLPPYLARGFFEGTLVFWRDALLEANPASKFLAVDILFLAAVVLIWMVTEARKHSIPGIWIYVPVAFFIGISFAVPIFMAHREMVVLKSRADADEHIEWSIANVLLVIVILIITLVGAAVTFNESM